MTIEHLTVDNNGVSLAVSVVGAGPDVLFVHGLGSAQVLWRPIIGELSGRYRCWNLDLRGHGASDRTPGGYTDAGYASDVAAALDHIGQPTIGVGHSLGGRSLVQVGAQEHPHLTGAFAVDSGLFRRNSEDRPAGLLRVFGAQLDMIRQFQPEDRPVDDYEAVLAAAPYVGGGTNADNMLPDQLRGRAESLSQLDPECLEVVVSGTFSPTASVAPEVVIPLRVLGADPELGASVRPEHDEQLLALTPHAEIRHLEGVGHQMMMIRGYDEIVLDDLAEWLGRVS